MTNQEIIRQVKQGNIECFAALVDRYHRPLLSFINTLTRNPALTEDIGQMVFLSFFKYIGTFDENDTTPVTAWLFTAVRHSTINAVKKESRFTLHSKPEELADIGSAPCGSLLQRRGLCLDLRKTLLMRNPG